MYDHIIIKTHNAQTDRQRGEACETVSNDMIITMESCKAPTLQLKVLNIITNNRKLMRGYISHQRFSVFE